MHRLVALLACAGIVASSGSRLLITPHPLEPTMKKLSPLIAVEEIEPCLPFWTERLGFEVTVTVPHEDRIGFAILQKDAAEIMYQSRASMDADIPGLADALVGQTTTLFIEVEAIDPLEEALAGAEVVVPRRQTFYGMDEIFVRADCGTVVGFAAALEEA